MNEQLKVKKVVEMPRLPFQGSLDLSYRCTNNCRHCWVIIPPESPEIEKELRLDEIIQIVKDARSMGCREWYISGGEPMLRPDFAEIFDFITRKSVSFTLNTNGTLITPKIAKLLKRKGSKLIALYGADAKMHDHITRTPGSFDAAMQGIAYLREAKAGFAIQIIPMKDNYKQLQDMIRLAKSLSHQWRIGASWLFLSANGDVIKNREIRRQRLSPEEVVELDLPDMTKVDLIEKRVKQDVIEKKGDDRLFATCIAARRDFHIDPSGHMTFCSFIKDPNLRYDLRKGSFKECWEEFIPSLSEQIRGGKKFLANCHSCTFRSDCRWCPAYAYLEHREYSDKIKYLCLVAREKRKVKNDFQNDHRKYYQIADITLKVESSLPITEKTFQQKFNLFEVSKPGKDTVSIRHYFYLPNVKNHALGRKIYHKKPWTIYRKGNAWIYLFVSSRYGGIDIQRVAVFNQDYSRVNIYHSESLKDAFRRGNLHSLTLFPTDQVYLAQILADREGCYLHASGVVLEEKGVLFVGHSDAGKSTIVKMLKGKATILCDDRIIVRRHRGAFRVYGTWSHGEVPDVSAASAPLKTIFFLEKAKDNRLEPLVGKPDIVKRLLACLIKPFETPEWWEKTLLLMDRMTDEIPCYSLYFDKSGKIIDSLMDL